MFLEYIDMCRELRGIFNEIKNHNNNASKKECIRILELIPNIRCIKFMELLKELDNTLTVPLELVLKIKDKTNNPFPNYKQVYAYCINNNEESWLKDVKLNVDFNEMIEILDEILFKDYNCIVDSMNTYKES